MFGFIKKLWSETEEEKDTHFWEEEKNYEIVMEQHQFVMYDKQGGCIAIVPM